MADLKDPLLPPLPKPRSSTALLIPNPNPTRSSTSSSHRSLHSLDFLNLKKRGQGLRSWIRVHAETGSATHIEVDKFTMMRRCDLPARDLRLLDPLFVYPSTILGRERAIVVNLEQIRCVITADEVLLLNSQQEAGVVDQYVRELQRRLVGGGGEAAPDYLPFEFRALEVALEAACTFLDTQVIGKSVEFGIRNLIYWGIELF